MNESRRHGYIMLDTLIVMTVIVVVLSTTSVWVFKTMRYSAEVKQRTAHVRNISRISHQLRSDARNAKSITVDDKVVKIQTDDRAIEYTIKSNELHREASGGDQPHRDDFQFCSNAVLEWQAGDSANVVTLNIHRDFSKHSVSKEAPAKRLDSQIRIGAAAEVLP